MESLNIKGWRQEEKKDFVYFVSNEGVVTFRKPSQSNAYPILIDNSDPKKPIIKKPAYGTYAPILNSQHVSVFTTQY